MQGTLIRRMSFVFVSGLVGSGLLLGAAPTLANNLVAPTGTPIPRLKQATGTPKPIAPTATLKPAQITSTAKAETARATQEARNAEATATASARNDLIAALSEYLPLNVRDVVAYPNKYTSDKVFFTGRIFNVVEGNTDLQMWVGKHDEYERLLKKLSG